MDILSHPLDWTTSLGRRQSTLAPPLRLGEKHSTHRTIHSTSTHSTVQSTKAHTAPTFSQTTRQRTRALPQQSYLHPRTLGYVPIAGFGQPIEQLARAPFPSNAHQPKRHSPGSCSPTCSTTWGSKAAHRTSPQQNYSRFTLPTYTSSIDTPNTCKTATCEARGPPRPLLKTICHTCFQETRYLTP